MESLLDLITSQLGQDSYQKIGQQLGVDATQSRSAVESALPILISALARNAQQPQGASSLANALDRDHDGSILQNLDGFLKSPDQGAGGAILGHVLGGQRGKVEEYVSRSSGLSLGNTGPLLEMLAPHCIGKPGPAEKDARSGCGWTGWYARRLIIWRFSWKLNQNNFWQSKISPAAIACLLVGQR